MNRLPGSIGPDTSWPMSSVTNTKIWMVGIFQYRTGWVDSAIPVQRSEEHCRAPVSSHTEAATPPRSPSACGGASTPIRWYLGRQWAILIALAIRPIRLRVASNAITPRPTANLVGPPLLVLLGLPVVASEHTEQISHGPLTFKGSMAIPPISVPVSIHGRISTSPAARRITQQGKVQRRLQLAETWSRRPFGTQLERLSSLGLRHVPR
jgi:hypothetical protein